MAARCASASSSAVKSLRRNPSCAAAIVSAARSVMNASSLDHSRDHEIVAFPRGRVLENAFRIPTVAPHVLALLHQHGRDRGHRVDAGYVDFIKLLDKGKDSVQLALQMLDLVVVDRDAREMRDVADGLRVD